MRLKHSGQQLDAAITKVMSDYADVSDVDATPSDVRAGKHYVNSSKQLVEGTLADAEITLGAVVSSAYVEENNSGYPILIVPTATVEKAGYVSNIPNGSYPTKYIRVEEKSVTPSEETQNITPTAGKLLKNVTVNPIPEEYIVPSGTINITENGVVDVTGYATANVHVAGGGGVTAAFPSISVHPQNASYSAGGTATPLTVAASVSDGGTLSYQWQISVDGGTTYSNISGANTNTYTPDISAASAYMYRCVVTNTLGATMASTFSNAATITVTAASGYTLTITSWTEIYSNYITVTKSNDTQENINVEGTYTNIVSIDSINGGDSYQYIRINGNVTATPITLTGDLTITVECHCLTGDTLVTMADLSEKRIDEINIGDEILSYDWDTLQLVANKIVFTDKDENKSFTEYDRWTFNDGTVIKTVRKHEFYCVESKGMKYMNEWQIGEHAYKIDGTTPKLISHEVVKERVNHYKITGEKGTNYFANGLLNGDRHCPKNICLKEAT